MKTVIDVVRRPLRWSPSQRLGALVSATLIAGAVALSAVWVGRYGWPWADPVCDSSATQLAALRRHAADGLRVDGAWTVDTGSGRLVVARGADPTGLFTAVYLPGDDGRLTPLTTTAEYLTPDLARLVSLPDQQSPGFERVRACVESIGG